MRLQIVVYAEGKAITRYTESWKLFVGVRRIGILHNMRRRNVCFSVGGRKYIICRSTNVFAPNAAATVYVLHQNHSCTHPPLIISHYQREYG